MLRSRQTWRIRKTDADAEEVIRSGGEAAAEKSLAGT
jgi:hypothetical protein